MRRFSAMAKYRAFGVILTVLFVIILISACSKDAGPKWKLVGTGDCPGQDIAHSSGPNPDPAKCTDAVRGQTAVCWDTECTYKNIETGSCKGGVSPGRMYTCTGSKHTR